MSSVTESLLKGVKEAIQFAAGHKKDASVHKIKVLERIDVKEIRLHLHLSRSEFSKKFGFSTRTLEKWEQGVRTPDTAARAYLTVIAYDPNTVSQALSVQE